MCCVRPGVFEANASFFWLHSTLIAVDLPALERPAKAISGTRVPGRSRRWLTVVKKRACQSWDMVCTEYTAGKAKAGKLLYNRRLNAVVPVNEIQRRAEWTAVKNLKSSLRVS